MNKLWNTIPSLLLLLLFTYVDLSEQFPFKNDDVSQVELDRLISQAIDRSGNQQPSKSEYERYYKVRQFLMQRIHKSEAPATTTIGSIDKIGTKTSHFFNRSWWFNRQKNRELLDTDYKGNSNANFRPFPELKRLHSWQEA